MVNNLNNNLKELLSRKLLKAEINVSKISSPYQAIDEAIQLYKDFNVEQFKSNAADRLRNIIPSWLEYQSEEPDVVYDSIIFEYSGQEVPPPEAYSYGMYNQGLEFYDWGEWCAGQGLLLEPFSICKPLHPEILDSETERREITFDNESGIMELEALAYLICQNVFNEVFLNADSMGLFAKLQIKPRGMFLFEEHDMGSGQDPFYLKS